MIDITVNPDITIRQAMKALEKTAEKCLLVVDKNMKLLGTLTDGDLRRKILAGAQFSEDISGSYHKRPTILVRGTFNAKEVKSLLQEKKLNLIPVLDDKGKVVEYVSWKSLGDMKKHSQELADVPVVIMAGGRGTRMEPFTKVLPKPLIPIHEKPIIEHIIERFTASGSRDFWLTVNYKSRVLKAYFEELQPSYSVRFVEEKEPLGTGGSLKFFQGKFDVPFFVSNCDIIIEADYCGIYEFHKKEENCITLVASSKQYIVPYGTCELTPDGDLSHINEKPKYDFFVNTGFYILDSDIIDLIPEKKLYHITHLLEDARNEGKKVGVFPIDGDAWIDVGEWAEYRKAVEKL